MELPTLSQVSLPLTLPSWNHCPPHPFYLSPLLPAALLLSGKGFSSASAVKTPGSPEKCLWRTETLVKKLCSWQRTVYEGRRSVKIRSIKIVCKAAVVLICQPDHFPEGIQEGGRCCHPKDGFWFLKDSSSWFSEGWCQAASSLLRYPGRSTEGKGEGEEQATHCAFMPAATESAETFGDTDPHMVTEPPLSRSLDQELQSVPSPSCDFRDGWPSQRSLSGQNMLSVLARPDADLLFLRRLIKGVSIIFTHTQALSQVVCFLRGIYTCL